MTSLYRPDELVTSATFLRQRFGTSKPERHDLERWKVAEIAQFFDSPIFAISNYFRTADKSGNLLSIQPFSGQAVLDVCIESQRRKGVPQRVVEIKPRQVGWSTWCLGRLLHNAMRPNRRGMFLVPDEDVVAVMSTRMGTMVNGLPMFLQPMRRIQNIKHVVLDNPNQKDRQENAGLASEMQITVPSPMRGIPPQFLIISEYSHMDPTAQYHITSSILPAIPESEYTCVIVDTTPNSFNDFYYPMVMEAVENNPKWIHRLENAKEPYTAQEILEGKLGEPDNPERGYVPAFSRWLDHEEYACKDIQHPRGELKKPKKAVWDEFLADVGKNAKFGGEEELELRQRYGVSDSKLFWRRRKIGAYKMPTQDMQLATFHQEFLTTIDSAFIESGKTPFDRECLDAVERQKRDPIARGCLRMEGDVIGVDQTFKSDWQDLRIYAPPQAGEQYALGIDTNIAYENPESDATVGCVMRYRDRKVVAVYTARVPEHIALEQLFLMYRWYFNAYYAVELKGQGYELQRKMITKGATNVYYWKRLDVDPNELTPSRYPGWETSGKTRPKMDSALLEAVCHRDAQTGLPDPSIIIPDAQMLKELRSLTRSPSGALKASNGHDDHTDSACICLCIMDDPFGGFHRGPTAQQQREFESDFQRSIGGRTFTRNRPSLANI